MEFTDYMSIKRRIVKTSNLGFCNIECLECPLSDKHNGIGVGCQTFETRYPEKAEDIVKQWAKEHPKKTYMEDFLEKFPKAEKDEHGIPEVCRKNIYGGTKHCSNYDSCTECWNEPMEEDPAHE